MMIYLSFSYLLAYSFCVKVCREVGKQSGQHFPWMFGAGCRLLCMHACVSSNNNNNSGAHSSVQVVVVVVVCNLSLSSTLHYYYSADWCKSRVFQTARESSISLRTEETLLLCGSKSERNSCAAGTCLEPPHPPQSSVKTTNFSHFF